MSQGDTSAVSAILSIIVLAIFWLSIVLGLLATCIIAVGIAGSLGGGALQLPWLETLGSDIPAGQMVGALLGIVTFSAGTAFICSQLRRILSTLAQGDPFVPENGPRLLRIAVAIALIELVRNIAVFVLDAVLDLGTFEPRLTFSLAGWGAVVVLVILAQVFREGTRLREEEKMTI